MTDSIHQYVYGKGSKKNKRVGVLLGVKRGDKVIITGSKVNLSAGDRFNPEIAQELAWDRLAVIENYGRSNHIARSMKDDVSRFEDRCKRYFKTDNIEVPKLDEVKILKGGSVFQKNKKCACN